MRTPVLIINRDIIRNRYRELSRALPAFEIAYAIKANPHLGIIETLRAEGASFETASIYELEYLISKGILSSKMVFSNPVKAPRSIRKSIDYGIDRIAFDSVDEVNKFRGLNARLYLRIAVPNAGSLWPLDRKFGASPKQWPAIFKSLRENNLDLEGIAFHVGSQSESTEGWQLAFSETRRAVSMARHAGLKPRSLNIGGGLAAHLGRPLPPLDSIASIIFSHIEKFRKELDFADGDLICEPGRYLSGDAGVLVASVIGVAERDDMPWVFLDAGVFQGMMETIDNISYPVFSDSTGGGEAVEMMLCGPTCDSVDKMYRVKLARPETGDRLYFRGAGAYSTVYTSEFNGFKAPSIIYNEIEFSEENLAGLFKSDPDHTAD